MSIRRRTRSKFEDVRAWVEDHVTRVRGTQPKTWAVFAIVVCVIILLAAIAAWSTAYAPDHLRKAIMIGWLILAAFTFSLLVRRVVSTRKTRTSTTPAQRGNHYRSQETHDEAAPDTAQLRAISASRSLDHHGFTRNDEALETIPRQLPVLRRAEAVTCDAPERSLRYGFRRPQIIRQLQTDENGVNWLEVTTYTKVPQGRLKKARWTCKTQSLKIIESRYCKPKVAKRLPIRPTDDETEIHVMMRRHRFSHLPSCLLVLLLVGAVIGGLVALYVQAIERTYTPYAIAISVVVGAYVYFLVRARWSRRYFVATNLRVHYLYDPPFPLPSADPTLQLVRLASGVSPAASMAARIFGYGIIRADTPSNTVDPNAKAVDAWFADGINFIPYYKDVTAVINQLIEDSMKHNPLSRF